MDEQPQKRARRDSGSDAVRALSASSSGDAGVNSPDSFVRIEASNSDESIASPNIEIVNSSDDDIQLYSIMNIIIDGFPLADLERSAEEAAAIIAGYLSKQLPIPGINLLLALSTWFASVLQALSENPTGALSVLRKNAELWENISKIFVGISDQTLSPDRKLGARKPYQETMLALKNYATFARWLLQADVEAMRDVLSRLDTSGPPQLISTGAIDAHDFLLRNNSLWQSLGGMFYANVSNSKLEVALELCRDRGLQDLLEFGTRLLDLVHVDKSFELPLTTTFELTDTLLPLVNQLVLQSLPGLSPATLGQLLCTLFQSADERLRSNLENQRKVLSATSRLTIAHVIEKVLPLINQLDEKTGEELRLALVGDGPNVDSEILVALWQIKICEAYLSKGNMDSRISFTNMLSQSLRDFCEPPAATGQPTPELRLVAQALIDSNITGAIFGVDSQAQIIEEALSICQFLIFTREHSIIVIDQLWNAITADQNSPNAAASACLLQKLLLMQQARADNLFTEEDLVHLCQKIRTSPPACVTRDFLGILNCLCRIVLPQPTARNLGATSESRIITEARGMLMELMQVALQTSPHSRGYIADHLSTFGTYAPFDLRRAAYVECLSSIQADGGNSDAMIEVLFALTRPENTAADWRTLVEELDIVHILTQDLERFNTKVKIDEIRKSTDPLELCKLQVRVWLLIRLAVYQPEALIGENFPATWKCLFEDNAFRNAGRDTLWSGLHHISKRRTPALVPVPVPFLVDNVFLDVCLTEGLPTITHQHFTRCLLDFLVGSMPYVKNKIAHTPTPKVENIMTNIVELLWGMLSETNDESLNETASEYLVQFYLDSLNPSAETYGAETEVTKQQTVVTRCLSLMEWGFKASSSHSGHIGSEAFPSHPEHHAGARAFHRAINLLVKLLYRTQIKPSMSGIHAGQQPTLHASRLGEPISFKCRISRYTEPGYVEEDVEEKDVEAGEHETRAEFHARLRQITRFSLFRVTSDHVPIDLLERPVQTLRTLKRTIQKPLNVQELPPSCTDWCYYRSAVNLSPNGTLEATIMDHFNDLYAFMAKGDEFAQLTYRLLNIFAPHQEAISVITSKTGVLDQLLAAEAPFQCMYGIRCLRFALEEASLTSISTELLNHGINVLGSFLTNNPTLHQLLTTSKGSNLISLVVTTLKEYLSASNSSDKLDGVDGKKLMVQVISMLRSGAPNATQHNLAVECFALGLELILHSQGAWEELQGQSDIHRTLLLKPSTAKFSRDIADTVILSVLRMPEPAHLGREDLASWYWEVVTSLIGDAIQVPQYSGSLFELAYELFVWRYSKAATPGFQDDLVAYALTWADAIQEYEPLNCQNEDENGAFLRAFGLLLRECITKLSYLGDVPALDGLEVDILRRLLFPQVAAEICKRYVPILQSEPRETLYGVVAILCKDDQRLVQVLSEVQRITEVNTIKNLRGDTELMMRSPAGYVGLDNLSNTCYMDALLTQLFMNVPFRKFLLEIPVDENDTLRPLLRETQTLLAFLQDSRARSFRPEHFIRCLSFYGETIDINNQMDAEEFLNILFDQLQRQMPTNGMHTTFSGFYGSKQITQIMSKECEHISHKEDTCSVIQCNVAGLANLHESLARFVRGEELKGENKYKCEQCNDRYVDAVKRVCFHDTQDGIIFHLMRFTWSPITGNRAKLHDRFDFPLSIDMTPYKHTTAMNPDAQNAPDIYELVGVIVHVGEAEEGHYKSYIRERPTPIGQPVKWFEFDDDTVTEFDINLMSERFYGGQLEIGFTPKMKSDSAYMLFYQRSTTLSCSPGDVDSKLKVRLPDWFAQRVELRNQELFRDLGLLGYPHEHFMIQLLTDLRGKHAHDELHESRKQLIRLSCQYVWRVLNKRDLEFGTLIDELSKTLGDCVTCNHFAVQILTTETTNKQGTCTPLHELVLRSPHPAVRSSVRKLIVNALHQLRESPELYGVDVGLEVGATDSDGALRMTLRAVSRITVTGLSTHSHHWTEFFSAVCDIARLGPHEAAAMIGCDTFLGILQTLSAVDWERWHANPENKYMDRLGKAITAGRCMDKVIEAMYELLRYIDIGCNPIRSTQAPLSAWRDGKLPMNASEALLFRFVDEKSRLSWLKTCLNTFDTKKAETGAKIATPMVPTFANAALIPLIWQSNPDPELVSRIRKTVLDMEGVNTTQFVNHVRAASELCKVISTDSVFTKTHLKIFHQVHPDTAEDILEFYNTALTLDQHKDRALETCEDWVFSLLGPDSLDYVREQTDHIFTYHFIGDEATRHDNDTAREMRLDLARSFLKTARKEAKANIGAMSKSDWVPFMDVVAKVVDYLWRTVTAFPALKKLHDDDLIETVESKLALFLSEVEASALVAVRHISPPDDDSESDSSGGIDGMPMSDSGESDTSCGIDGRPINSEEEMTDADLGIKSSIDRATGIGFTAEELEDDSTEDYHSGMQQGENLGGASDSSAELCDYIYDLFRLEFLNSLVIDSDITTGTTEDWGEETSQ